MIYPTDADVGRKVLHRQDPEAIEGVITRVAQLYVLVRYNEADPPRATKPEDLLWA